LRCGAKYFLRVPPETKCEYGFAKILDKCLRIDASRRPSIGDVVDAIKKLVSL